MFNVHYSCNNLPDALYSHMCRQKEEHADHSAHSCSRSQCIPSYLFLPPAQLLLILLGEILCLSSIGVECKGME